jgi:hypothetical protein
MTNILDEYFEVSYKKNRFNQIGSFFLMAWRFLIFKLKCNRH